MSSISADLIRAQLAKILSNSLFSRSPRLSRFLELVVMMKLEGDDHRIKEYLIGTEVFERGERFDPRIDPIVRLQAAKLRSKLVEYYSDEGRDDPVVIQMARGGYVPSFHSAAERAARKEEAPAVPGAASPSIAVLPFVNISPKKGDEYFSNGLTEEIIGALASVPGLQVVARTSVCAFKDQALDAREIGRRLQVQTILEGSVRKWKDRVRITAQLVDVASGYHLVSRTYDRRLEDLFAIQEEIARTVVQEIADRLDGPVNAPHTRRRPAHMESYDYYLRGRFALASGVGESLTRCIDLFVRALEFDPEYAPAWAGLADTYVLLAWWSAMPEKTALPMALEAGRRSLELDESLAEAHGSIAAVACLYQWDWDAGEREYRRALELQPGSSHAHWGFAQLCLLARGRVEEAVEHLETCVRLNPLDLLIRTSTVYAMGVAGRFEEAQQHFREAVRLDPTYPMAYLTMGLVLRMAGRLEEAVEALENAVRYSHELSLPLAALGHAFASAGDQTSAQGILRKLLRRGAGHDFELATVYSGLRQRKRTLDLLERALRRKSIHMVLLPFDFHFAWLAEDARFKALLERMGVSFHGQTLAARGRRRPKRRRLAAGGYS